MNARIPDYDLDRPRAEELSESLAKILGPDEADTVISVALRELDMPKPKLTELPADALLHVARAITRQRGLPSVIARSFVIRLTSHMQLEGRASS